MKLVIERSRWLRGEGDQASRLLRPTDGKMCCLGFMACQLGYTEEEISNGDTPLSSIRLAKKNLWPQTMVSTDASFTSYTELDGTFLIQERVVGALMETNDIVDASLIFNNDLIRSNREDVLKELFKSIDIEVEFVD